MAPSPPCCTTPRGRPPPAVLADAVTYATTGGGEPFIRSLIVHRQSDGLLVAYIDTRPDLLPFNVAAEVPVRFSWAGGTVLTL
jgi:hypothetical protein